MNILFFQMNKAPIQAFADYISSIFVPTVLCLALLTLIVWLFLGFYLIFFFFLFSFFLNFDLICILGYGHYLPEGYMPPHTTHFLYALRLALLFIFINI